MGVLPISPATKTVSPPSSHYIRDLLNLGGQVQVRNLSLSAFYKLCEHFPDLQIERDKNGLVNIMPPTYSGSSFRESDLIYYVRAWQKQHKNGQVASSSGGFTLPDGAVKSPDAAWICAEKMATLTADQIEGSFLPVVPDFIVEIRSATDSLSTLKIKMRNVWMANGVRLAWLLDPYAQKAWIFRAGREEALVVGFDKELSGEDVMPGFILPLSEFKALK